MTNRKHCDECGLPIMICNAIAMYKKAGELLDREKVTEAKDAMTSGDDFYEAYRLDYANGAT